MPSHTEVLMEATRPTAAALEASFNAALQTHKVRLYGIAYSILRDHREAEDALQDAMVKAWNRWDSVRAEEAREGWLIRVTVNHCINHRRGLLRSKPSRSMNERDSAPADPRFSARLVDLDRGYRNLSAKQRAATFLHYHYGYSIDECADLMSCSPGSVRTHLARAIASLRKEMAQ
jgi:RNA polymerase sigma-70 factor (ECF subfamily)